jgi:hypothetical protein
MRMIKHNHSIASNMDKVLKEILTPSVRSSTSNLFHIPQDLILDQLWSPLWDSFI